MKDFTFETKVNAYGDEMDANVYLEVTSYVNKAGDHSCTDSEEDFFGYKEVAYVIKCVDLYSNGDLVGELYTEAEIDALNLDDEEIVEFLFKQME